MRKICGIITEYNPFHNGHFHHLANAKKITNADFVIAFMSGDFVQRGEPAIIDKYKRTQMAIASGVDMVIQLPTPIASSSARGFAEGALKLMAATNIVDSICFGSELGELTPLITIARHLCDETKEFKVALKQELARGASFPAARAFALAATLSHELPNAKELLFQPNNILGVEYIRAIIKNNLPIKPHATMRHGVGHNSKGFLPGATSASAGAIRRFIWGGGDVNRLNALMPKPCYDILQDEYSKGAINSFDNLSQIFHHELMTHNIDSDLKRRVLKAASEHYLISEIVMAAKAKNYTHTGLQRAALSIVLQSQLNSATDQIKNPQFIRVLGFKKASRALIGFLHKKASLPIVTNLKYIDKLPKIAQHALNQELNISKIYYLGLRHKGIAAKNEFSQSMIML